MQKIGSYKLVKEIGKGRYGTMYKTVNAKTGKESVLERIPKKDFSKSDQNKLNISLNFLHEIHHQNFLRFKDSLMTERNYYVIYDNYNGYTLAECLEEYKKKEGKPFPEKIVQHFMKGIVSGIQYLHNSWIIHRGICLDNFIVDFGSEENFAERKYESSKIKIRDMGNGKVVTNSVMAKSLIDGIPKNMDPVILKEKEKTEKDKNFQYDLKTDIWSIGTVCFELLVGAPPFDGTNAEIIEKYNKGNIVIPNNLDLSKQSIHFINAMLRSNPNSRLDINLLACHEFLTKNVELFDKISLIKRKQPKEINFNIKSSSNLWNQFESEEDLVPLEGEANNTFIDKSIKQTGNPTSNLIMHFKNGIKEILTTKGVEENEIQNREQKEEEIKNENQNDKEQQNKEKKGIQEPIDDKKEVQQENKEHKEMQQQNEKKSEEQKKLKILNSYFDKLNNNSFNLNPMLIPLCPEKEKESLHIDMEF